MVLINRWNYYSLDLGYLMVFEVIEEIVCLALFLFKYVIFQSTKLIDGLLLKKSQKMIVIPRMR